MSTDLFSSLTDAQSAAVAHIDGPLLVLAGPGSGKTRVVTFRIANILRHDIAARQILALTFTNKAAEEMQARLNRLVPGEPVWMGTFHRFCSRLLRQYAAYVGLDENFTIYDTNDSRKVVQHGLETSPISCCVPYLEWNTAYLSHDTTVCSPQQTESRLEAV